MVTETLEGRIGGQTLEQQKPGKIDYVLALVGIMTPRYNKYLNNLIETSYKRFERKQKELGIE